MARLRQWGPYIYATWAAKLLAGDNSCEWAYQFQARHDKQSYRQAVNSGNWALYSMRHTSLLRRVRNSWQEDGFESTQEDQNWFAVPPRKWGGDATLGGKPDLIVSDEDTNIIIDAKAGNPSNSHVMQVMFYMYAVPLGLPQYRNVRFEGRVAYEDHEIRIEEVSDEFVFELKELARRLASDTPAVRVPSVRECEWCKITLDDCSVRIEDEPVPAKNEPVLAEEETGNYSELYPAVRVPTGLPI